MWKILSHEFSSAGAALAPRVCRSSPLSLCLGQGDWSERKDSGSLVGERRGRKGNQATWANTWGSAWTLRTQMCSQLRLPGSRRQLCFSLISSSFSFSFVYLFFHSPSSCSLIIFCLSSILPSALVVLLLPSHLDDYSKITGLEKLWTEPAANESTRLGPIWGHHRWVQHALTHPQHKPSD